METSALFGTRNFRFFEIYDVSNRQGIGVEPVPTFCEQGGGVNFSRFFEDVSYGGL